MRIYLPLALVLAVTASTPGYGWELCNLFGLRCGLLGCGGSCEPSCGCDPCACDGEVGCACEASCGCGSECGGGCPQYGGQTWNCCEPGYPLGGVPICECTGPTASCATACGCGEVCGCADGCEPGLHGDSPAASCGCDPCGCGAEVGCGCEPSCGCGSAGGNRGCCLNGVFFGSCCGQVVGMFEKLCGGCNGCGGEVYWSEWHNDPPRCHAPCDCCGNFTGPSYGGVRAPYDQGYHVGSSGVGSHYAGKHAAAGTGIVAGATNSLGATVASRPRASRAPTYRNESAARPSFTASKTNGMRHVASRTLPITRGQIARKPATGPGATYQR